jgi:hypothetical protein
MPRYRLIIGTARLFRRQRQDNGRQSRTRWSEAQALDEAPVLVIGAGAGAYATGRWRTSIS